MMNSNNLAEIHPKRWSNQLDFLQDEVKYLQNQLASLIAGNPQGDVQKIAIKFKQDFFMKLREIDKLRFSSQTIAENPFIREEVEMLTRNFQRLKNCFCDFVSDNEVA